MMLPESKESHGFNRGSMSKKYIVTGMVIGAVKEKNNNTTTMPECRKILWL